MPDAADRIEIENVVSPHHRQKVDRTKYTAMREALLAVLPNDPPGLTVASQGCAAAASSRGSMAWRGQGGLVVEGRPARSGGERCHTPRCDEAGAAVSTNGTHRVE